MMRTVVTGRPMDGLHVIPWLWNIDGDKAADISDTARITDDGCVFFELERGFVRA